MVCVPCVVVREGIVGVGEVGVIRGGGDGEGGPWWRWASTALSGARSLHGGGATEQQRTFCGVVGASLLR